MGLINCTGCLFVFIKLLYYIFPAIEGEHGGADAICHHHFSRTFSFVQTHSFLLEETLLPPVARALIAFSSSDCTLIKACARTFMYGMV